MSSLRQSFSWWCFNNRGVEPDALLAGAAKIGYQAVDLIDEEFWPLAHKHGLTIAAIAGHASIEDGLNRRENAARIEKELRTSIEKASEAKIPVVLCFAGDRAHTKGEEAGLEICAETLGRIVPVAADAGVIVALELLNSKVDHPGYQGDHTSWGVELCKRVNSPAFKLLYDIYHMQIMEGDIIRTIESNHAFFAHYHTAGVPGRVVLDENQELYYPPIYRAIAKTGYTGFISHEFPAKGDPLKAMKLVFDDCAAAC